MDRKRRDIHRMTEDDSSLFCHDKKKKKHVYMKDPPTPCFIPYEVEIEELISDFKKLRITEE